MILKKHIYAKGIFNFSLSRLWLFILIAIMLSGTVFKRAESLATAFVGPAEVNQVAIIMGRNSTEPERRAALILADRIQTRSKISVKTAVENEACAKQIMDDSDIIFVPGTADGSDLTKSLIKSLRAKLPMLPNSQKNHREGFVVKSGAIDGKHFILIAGTDPRGTFYGVGWTLRAMTYLPEKLLLPPMNAQDKPAFWIRGGQPSGPGSRARDFGRLRPRTAKEERELMEDQMLLGINIFQVDPKIVRPYGMMTLFSYTANRMQPGFPTQWGADGGRSQGWICPSVPEARKALLESFDRIFRNGPEYDFFFTNSGDVGGCRCERCMPWGGTYIKLVHEIADLLHKYHPNTKVLATNQDLTNEGNQAIFEYLNTHDMNWLFAISYGPGADEMQTYIRGPVNSRWFEYEGFGPLGNYLKYMHRVLPRSTNIVLYTDITHWMQAQFAVPHPDIALAAVYDRRSWNARPRNFHKVSREIMHYALGDIPYSEGMHDDFNKWFWYRMLWNPQQDAETVTKQYCRYWFGPDAQDEMAQAIFLMEENLEKPVLGNRAILHAADLLRSAGKKIPQNLLILDFRWRVIAEKALMDRYIQLKLERGQELKTTTTAILQRALSSKEPAAEFEKALCVLNEPLVTAEMKSIKAEAVKLSDEANQIAGFREPIVFLVDDLDLTEVGWWKKTIQEALSNRNASHFRNAAQMVLRYEDPGEGGFYEDVGWPNDPQHLVYGQTLWGFLPFPGPAKQSLYNFAYTLFEPRGVTFNFDGLDPKAQYVVRISTGIYLKSDTLPDLQNIELKESLIAEGQAVGETFSIPLNAVTYHEFDLPQTLTHDGNIEITLTSPFSITGLNEIWLMRRRQNALDRRSVN